MCAYARWGRVFIVSAAMWAFTPQASSAQFVERPPRSDTLVGMSPSAADARTRPETELFQNATVDLNNVTPKLGMKAVKWYALVFDRWIPFYLVSNVPMAAPVSSDSVKYVANELLNQFGGLLNASLSRDFPLESNAIRGKKGMFIDLRAGGRVVEILQEGRHFHPVGHATATLNWYIPLANEEDLNKQRGLVTLNVGAYGNYIGSDRYRQLFSTPPGVDGVVDQPTRLPLGASAFLSFHIFEEFYVSAGAAVSSENALGDRKFIAFSYSRSP